MKLVLDTSVAAKFVLPELDSDKARNLRDEAANGLHELLAPDIFPAELAHLLTRAERQKRIAIGQADALWQSVMLASPKLFPYLPLAQRAIQRSSSVRMGFYDCLYLALAERERCDFITADSKIVANLQNQFAFILEPGDVP